MAAAAILNFGKMSITLYWIMISCIKLQRLCSSAYGALQICFMIMIMIWEGAPRRRGDDHVTKSRNRTLIRVTSSHDGLKQMCVDLSDYNIYLEQIWYITQIPHYQHAGMAKFI